MLQKHLLDSCTLSCGSHDIYYSAYYKAHNSCVKNIFGTHSDDVVSRDEFTASTVSAQVRFFNIFACE